MFRAALPCLVLCLVTQRYSCYYGRHVQHLTVEYSWITLDFDWEDGTTRESAFEDGFFNPENTIPENIAVSNDIVFLSIPRSSERPGVPYTLGTVITKDGKPVVKPYPDYLSQTEGNCTQIQDVVSMKVDRRAKEISVLDRGRNTVTGKCPTKLLIFDLENDQEVSRYVFPPEVAPDNGGVNDMTLDRDKTTGQVRWYYISDFLKNVLIVYDRKTSNSWTFEHCSMKGDGTDESKTTTINNQTFGFPPFGLNALSMSPSYDYLYYTALTAFTTWQIPTSVLRNQNGQAEFCLKARNIGTRASQTSAMTTSTKSLFYTVVSKNQISKWEWKKDTVKTTESEVFLHRKSIVARDNEFMVYPDGLDIVRGKLWFLADKIFQTALDGLDFSARPASQNPNFVVGYIYIGEDNYLDHVPC